MSQIDRAELSRRLRALREHYGISQADLSDGSGVSRPVISRIETANDYPPSLDSCVKLSQFFDMSLDEFLPYKK